MTDDGLESLDEELRGMLVAFAALGAEAAAWADLEAPRRESVDRAWQELEALDQAARDRTLAAWRREAADAVSTGLARLHPSWIEEELAGERPELVAAVRNALTAGGEAEPCARNLARLALGRCLALCEAQAGPLAEALCTLPPDALLDDIARRGARVVGRSLGGAAPALRARAMAAAGEPWAQEIAAGARQARSPAQRAAAVALVECAGAREGKTPHERLLVVGLAALKDELAAEAAGSSLRVAGRLPAPLGRALLGW